MRRGLGWIVCLAVALAAPLRPQRPQEAPLTLTSRRRSHRRSASPPGCASWPPSRRRPALRSASPGRSGSRWSS